MNHLYSEMDLFALFVFKKLHNLNRFSNFFPKYCFIFNFILLIIVTYSILLDFSLDELVIVIFHFIKHITKFYLIYFNWVPMMCRLFTLFLVLALVFVISGQQCLNKDNQKVDWWLVIQIPDSVSTGYAYFDSSFAAPTLAVYP